MEGRKKKPSSSPPPPSPSSLTSQLFGSSDNPFSPSSSSTIFASIFTPPSVSGRESMRQQETVTGDKTSSDVNRYKEENENVGSTYEEQRVQQPCHLSSSIYYGGPDVYFHPHNSNIDSTNKKDGSEDDSGSASRGNWWQGSLYY